MCFYLEWLSALTDIRKGLGEARRVLNTAFGLFFKLNAGCKGFTKWFDHIRLLVSGLVTIIGKSMGNSTANIQCCSNLGKMLFVHFLRLLYAFQTNIRQMLNTCWQTLACKQGRISRRQRTNVWFQSGTRTVTCQGRWWDEQLITTISLINLKLPWQKSRSHPLSNVAPRYPLSQKWRFYLFKSIKTEKQPQRPVADCWLHRPSCRQAVVGGKKAGIFFRMEWRTVSPETAAVTSDYTYQSEP